MRDTIRRVAIFKGLDDKLLRKVASTAITCTFASGETVVRAGEPGIGMYFVLRGRVAVTLNQGGVEKKLGEVGTDGFFGELALIDEKPRLETVVTLADTECLLFTRDTFLRLVENHPSLSLQLARVLADRLRTAMDQPTAAAASVGEALVPVAAGPASESGLKNEVQKKLVSTFESLYTAKAFSRFAVAILGCPVEGSCTEALETIRVGHVKAIILPAAGASQLAINAFGPGQFQLHVFHPDHFGAGAPMARRFDPVPIQPRDRFVLSLPDAQLRRVESSPVESSPEECFQ